MWQRRRKVGEREGRKGRNESVVDPTKFGRKSTPLPPWPRPWSWLGHMAYRRVSLIGLMPNFDQMKKTFCGHTYIHVRAYIRKEGRTLSGGESSLMLAFSEHDEIPELAASTRLHWTAEIFAVKMISSSRLKPHETGWSRLLLSPSLRESRLAELPVIQHKVFWHKAT